ncbi:MAG: DUF4956 domain-containing protein [Candidatus Latescibacterota bacterium]
MGLEELLSLSASALTTGQIARNLLVALVCGLLVALFYAGITGRAGHTRTFATALVALSLITALVIMVIGNNLARAFGLVGAMSIIRFRTAVKDVQDIVFVFFALAVGMAAGVGLAALAFIGTLSVALVMAGASRLHHRLERRRDWLLQLNYLAVSDGRPPYLAALERHCSRHHLLHVKSYGSEEPLELAFHIQLRHPGRGAELVRDLAQTEGVQQANLFVDEEYAP